MTPASHLVSQIDEAFAASIKEDGLRSHLGASQIGDACMRKVWFQFRWAATEQFDGRMLRLFETGQLYEERFTKLLRLIGAKVYTHDSEGKQFKVSAHGGHFGGSCDGVATGIDPSPVLLEMKTWNAKNFAKLAVSGVDTVKPQHVRQAQVYMHFLKLKKCLYMAVCKDTDALHLEWIDYDPTLAERMVERAEVIIFGQGLPVRISDNVGYWECRFCSMSKVCHEHAPALVNCRTCQHSKPERNGTWSCSLNREEIGTQPKAGCQLHEYLPELI